MTQGKLFNDPPPAGPEAPPLGTPASDLVLPEKILALPFWYDFAWLVTEGIKTLETRSSAWERPPGWIVVYATKGRGPAHQRPILPAGVELPPLDQIPRQALTCLLWIAGSRPLRLEDTAAACFYEAGRYALEITRRYPFRRPIPLAESGLSAPPQGPVYVSRAVVARGLLAA